MAINNTITVKKLLDLCEEQVKAGNGDKHILISQDSEGNGFHHLLYAFSTVEKAVMFPEELPVEENELKDIIILG